MLIDYSVTRTFNQTIDVVDIGNTCLHCMDSEGGDYYIITKTIMGQFHMLSFGPVMANSPDLLCPDFTSNYVKQEYKENKIFKLVSSYVNDPKKGIQTIEEITPFEGLEQFPSVIDDYNRL